MKLIECIIRQEKLSGLDERHSAMLAAFHLGSAYAIVVNNLSDSLLHFALGLIAFGFGVNDGDVIVSAVAMVKKGLSQNQDVLPVSLRQTGLGQDFPDFAPNDKSLTAGSLDNLLGYPLQVG